MVASSLSTLLYLPTIVNDDILLSNDPSVGFESVNGPLLEPPSLALSYNIMWSPKTVENIEIIKDHEKSSFQFSNKSLQYNLIPFPRS